VGNFEPTKITPNFKALAKSIMSYLWVSYFTLLYMQWCQRSVHIALRDINKKGVEIGER